MEFHTPSYWLIPSKTRHLALRETALVHKEYKNYIQIIHSSMQAEGNDFGASSTSDRHQTGWTHPTLQPQSDPINMATQDPKKENL